MAMDPRTHPRGAPPDFSMAGMPANPNPRRITDALWWLVQMRLRLEPRSENGGILAIKPGYHSYGSRLPDYGVGDSRTDHSIRRAPDRRGPWWEDFASAHDWTFTRAHSGNYTEINLYCNRLRDAMRDPDDPRPDNTYAYFIGQIDNDRTVEGYNEYRDQAETGDESHLWHRHDSFRRDIVGDRWALWAVLTIDMGWTVSEWRQSVDEGEDMPLSDADIARIWAYDPGNNTTGATNGGVKNPDFDPKTETNATVQPVWPLYRTLVIDKVVYQNRDKLDQLLTVAAKILQNVTADDAEAQQLIAEIHRAQEATVAGVGELLGAGQQSPAAVAAALRDLFGPAMAAQIGEELRPDTAR